MGIQWQEMQSGRRQRDMEKKVDDILDMIAESTKKRKARGDGESAVDTSVRPTKKLKVTTIVHSKVHQAVHSKQPKPTPTPSPTPPPTPPIASIPAVDAETKALLQILAREGNRTSIGVLVRERLKQRNSAMMSPTNRSTSRTALATETRQRKAECTEEIFRLLTPERGVSIHKYKGACMFTLTRSYKASYKAQYST